jgi:hypothetical protein
MVSEWKFNRVNSKGEVKFKRPTNETLEDVKKHLDKVGVPYEAREGGSMMWIGEEDNKYSYYYTTGRWSKFNPYGMPKKHYQSKGIEDFLDRFYNK